MTENILSIKNLSVRFPISSGFFQRKKDFIKAVDDVSFTIKEGKTLGIVGESGSGKTTVGRSVIQLISVFSGEIFYRDVCISGLTRKEFFPYRKKIQMVFQDPFSSLNPRMKIASIISEPLSIHFKNLSKNAKKDRIVELLEKVGLEADHMNRFPHEFSGGQRQRIGIARALAVEPKILICDEPVSSLDVSIQAQILNLLKDLQKELKLTYMFIAHDMAVVEHMSDYIIVMKQGKIVEQETTETLFKNPQNSYTKKLIEAIPAL